MMPGLIGAISASRRRSTGPNMDGLVLYLDTSQLVGLSENDPITSATDWSGQGNHATQADPAKQPLYKTNILNGKPVMRFDGVDDVLVFADLSSLTEAEMFIVFSKIGNTDQKGIYFLAGHGAGHHHKWSDGNVYDGFASTTRWSFDPGTISGLHLLNVASTSTDYRFWLDGNLFAQRSPNVVSIVASGFLGVGAPLADNYFMSGDIAEVLLYNRTLSTAERQFEENRLTTKYALP